MPSRTHEEIRLRREVCAYSELCDDYHETLARILKWAKDHIYNNWSEAGDCEAYVNGPAEELIAALSEVGFEINHDLRKEGKS